MPKIDFSVTPPLIDTEYAGEKQEIDAVSLEIIPEKGMTDDTSLVSYAIYFATPNGLESSRTFSRGEQIKVDLWSDLTESEVLECQLIATNSDGSKISKSPVVRFVLGESLEGELVGADDRHDSLLAQIADLELKKHWHDNKSVLDRFGVSGSKPTFDGAEIGGGGIDIYDSTTGKSKYTLTELSQLYNSGNPLYYRGYLLTVFTASTLSFRAYYINPVNHTVRKFDVKADKSFFWYADITLADDSAVSTAIQGEANIRQASDNALSDRIDDVIAKSDVVDVVGTHADLEDYDTSTLGNNDLIKVLQDETKLYNRTYYRWIVADDDFFYVGEEPTIFVEIYDYDTGKSRYTPAELYAMWLQGDGKIFRYRGTLLTATAVFENQFSAQYLDKNTGKVFLVTVRNSKAITVEKVVHYARSILTDYGVEIGFYTYADGTERPYIRKVADT